MLSVGINSSEIGSNELPEDFYVCTGKLSAQGDGYFKITSVD